MTKPMPADAPRLKARPGHGNKANARNGGGDKGIQSIRARGFDTGTNAAAALIDPNKPLTDMQREFVKGWASGESILSASVRAGYADGGTFAYRMVRMPNILKAYNEEKRKYEEVSNMTRKRVMDGLLEGIEMAKTLADPGNVIAGWREVGKMCGYYAPVEIKHQVSVEGKVLIERMNRMSDEELFKMIETSANQIKAGNTPALAAPDRDEAEEVEDVTPKPRRAKARATV